MIRIITRLWSHPIGRLGLIAVGFNLLLFIFGPMLPPYDPEAFGFTARLTGSSLAHPFGTDEFGRDVLSRVMVGSRNTIGFGVLSTLIGTTVGAAIGIVSGYFGGLFDEIVMRFADAFVAIPNLLLSMLIVIAIGVSASGQREVLGLDVGPSEDGAFWLQFLRGLVARGLDGVRLVSSDAHQGLKGAIAAGLQGASWQRCRVHCVSRSIGALGERKEVRPAA